MHHLRHSSTPATTVAPLQRRQLLIAGLGAAVAACSPKDETLSTSGAIPVAARDAQSKDILAGAMLLPGLVNSSTDGPMIELLQAIAAAYQGGKTTIEAMPVGKVNSDIADGTIDLAIPFIRLRPDGDAGLRFRYSAQGYGRVTFVLYSRKAAPVTKASIDSQRGKASFPYKIESAAFDWGFPVIQFTDFESAFKKLAAGHIDAFLWAQEEADLELRRQGLKGIVREAYGTYDDVFALPRGPRGDFVEAILNNALASIRSSGELERIYAKIHRPYDPWQP